MAFFPFQRYFFLFTFIGVLFGNAMLYAPSTYLPDQYIAVLADSDRQQRERKKDAEEYTIMTF